MKFKVEIVETLVEVVETEAETAEDAVEIVEKEYRDDKCVLTAENFLDVEFKVSEPADRDGTCPVCGGKIEFTDNIQMDNGGVYLWECSSCGASGKQGYDEVFDGHHYDVRDAEGNSIPGRE